MKINFNDEVSGAVHFDTPIVALESTVIAHGLPRPKNLETARSMEKIVRDGGATPATIAVIRGEIYAGLSDKQVELLANADDVRKISRRDIAVAVAKKELAATTVASTSFIAHAAKIRVFATGGIGGVHRGTAMDVSADLIELARTPIVVVCSGAKSVLDLPKTREWLETYGITVLGWQTSEMPAFYSRSSGLEVDEKVISATEVARIVAARNELGLSAAILVMVPVPKEVEVPAAEVEALMNAAMKEAAAAGIRGKAVTPYLLSNLAENSGGRTLAANIALLENNARVAAGIAAALD
jgi:pseudouridine-5'-phosphate glycosidase